MAVIENSVVIDHPPEVVFDYAVDVMNEREWNPTVESVEKLTPGPVGLGTTYRAKWKRSPAIELECTKFQRPHRWAYRNEGPLSGEFSVTLTPHGESTLATVRFEVRPHGFVRFVFPFLLHSLRRQERENMGLLKRAIERK